MRSVSREDIPKQLLEERDDESKLAGEGEEGGGGFESAFCDEVNWLVFFRKHSIKR